MTMTKRKQSKGMKLGIMMHLLAVVDREQAQENVVDKEQEVEKVEE